jgi:RNA-directed DNA polymerase
VGPGRGHQVAESFDRISHQWLIDNIPMDKEVLGKWLKAGFLEKHVLFATTEGTPQGGSSRPQQCCKTVPDS